VIRDHHRWGWRQQQPPLELFAVFAHTATTKLEQAGRPSSSSLCTGSIIRVAHQRWRCHSQPVCHTVVHTVANVASWPRSLPAPRIVSLRTLRPSERFCFFSPARSLEAAAGDDEGARARVGAIRRRGTREARARRVAICRWFRLPRCGSGSGGDGECRCGGASSDAQRRTC
jgi:hypothetical protein